MRHIPRVLLLLVIPQYCCGMQPPAGGANREEPAEAVVAEVVRHWQARERETRHGQFTFQPVRTLQDYEATPTFSEPGLPEEASPVSHVLLEAGHVLYQTQRRLVDLKYPGQTDTRSGSEFIRAVESRFKNVQDAPSPWMSFQRSRDETRQIDRIDGEGRPVVAVISDPGSLREKAVPVDDWLFMGLLWSCRPLGGEGAKFSPPHLRLVRRNEQVNGEHCLVLEEDEEGRGSVFRQLWLAPQRDFALVRCVIWQQGQPGAQLDFRFEESTAPRWLPSAWSIVTRQDFTRSSQWYPGRQSLFLLQEARLISWKFGTPPTSQQKPETLPPGTIVIDRIDGQYYRLAEQGQRQPLSQLEAISLANSAKPSPQWRQILLAGAILLLSGWLVRTAWRRRKQPRRPRPVHLQDKQQPGRKLAELPPEHQADITQEPPCG